MDKKTNTKIIKKDQDKTPTISTSELAGGLRKATKMLKVFEVATKAVEYLQGIEEETSAIKSRNVSAKKEEESLLVRVSSLQEEEKVLSKSVKDKEKEAVKIIADARKRYQEGVDVLNKETEKSIQEVNNKTAEQLLLLEKEHERLDQREKEIHISSKRLEHDKQEFHTAKSSLMKSIGR